MQARSPADDRAAIAAEFAGFQRVPIDSPGLRAASVAVAVVIRRALCLLITKRAANLRNHAGQWAVWGGPVNIALRGPAAEVAQIHVIPLADLDRPPQLLRIPESERPVLRLPLLSAFVYAPTAAVIYQFCQLARHGLTTRVAHFDQPVFAWK